MAGALWAFLALALWSVWTIIMTRLRERLSGGSIARRSAGAAGTLFLWVGTMFFVLNPLSRASFDATKPAAWAAIGVMSLNSWFLAEVVGAVSHLLSGEERTIRALFRARQAGAFTPVAAILMLLSAMAMYAELVFPRLPREIGGGSKPTVQITLRVPAAPEMRALDLPWSPDGKSSGPVLLLVRTASTLVLQRPPDSQEASWNPKTWLRRGSTTPVVEIAADLVSAIQYAKCCP